MIFILKQIKFAEAHAQSGGGCEALLDILPNASLPWGLRTVNGSCNNLIPGNEGFGQADLEFLELVEPTFGNADALTQPFASNDIPGAQTSYVRGDGRTVQDSSPRLISNLIVNQSTTNPAAVRAYLDEEGEELGPDIAGANQFLIPNTAPDEGLSAPFNSFMTFFGQFFDHGLDLINKGGNGVVFMPLAHDDPLYDKGPDGVAGTADDGKANFMLLTRATRDAGPDGLIGTDDDGESIINATTPHVDQQQTYASHASNQILLRHYEMVPCALQPVRGCPHASGNLLNGSGNDKVLDTDDDGGMATWDSAQAQASTKLGLLLDDFDGANVPYILADPYGRFIRGPNGLPQLVIAVAANGTPVTLEGNLENPVDASQAIRVNQSFFLDVSHTANPGSFPGIGLEPELAPDADNEINVRIDMLSGQPTRGIRLPGDPLPSGQKTYDDELLGNHFICGDGRCNENIALTTIHTIFHAEHNRLAAVAQRVVLDRNDLAFLNEWLLPENPATQAQLDSWPGLVFPVSDASLGNQEATKAAIDAWTTDNNLQWNGERLFQTARFGTEMQYNRVVFDEFVPTLSGLKDDFEGFNNAVHPSITAEFSQNVYRFGHSMLTETVDRYDTDFNHIADAGALDPATASEQLGLFEAFLNPLALYNYDDVLGEYTLTPEEGTGAVIRGITRSVGNEIDEFITGGMQNNLVGLPLDIGAINIARGRDVGTPGLNAARRAFHAASQDTSVAPYANWVDYADNLRHELSIVNFIAAYGTHPTVAGGDGIPGNYSDGEPNAVEDRRKAACALVSAINVNPSFCVDAGFDVEPAAAAPADAEAFMRSQGDWATGLDGLPITGLEEIDFWNGGLSEERRPFTGYLGSTHNFVFESQMENLQNGDRFYYLGRTATIHMLGALESNSFASLVMRNTDLGELGAGSVPLNLFSVPNHNLEVVQDQQFNGVDSADPEAEAELVDLVIRDPNQATTNISVADPDLFLQYTGGDHVTMGGTPGRDTMIGGIGDDAIWGREGDDRIEGGDGADLIEGGPGDDIITDLSGPDVIEGGPGNDAISSGNEEDVIFGDQGSDFIINQSEFGEIFGGLDNDFIYDGMFIGHIRGGAGDDWMENLGGGEDLWQGDDGAAPEAGEPAVKGNDVFIAYGGNNDADMENGDDIIVDGAGIDRAEGQLGFDWISFANDEFGVNVDLDLTIFLRPILPPSNSSIQNRYDRVEGLSGSPLGDILRGTPNQLGADDGDALSISTDAAGRTTTDGFSLIEGYDDTATALALVPEVERTDLNPDPVTGDAQFGWSNGDIVLGGGASDLMIGEAGDDILDGDSSLKVNIETPNPGLRTGSLNAAALVTQEALDVAIAEYQSGFTNSILAEAEAAIAVDGLDALLAQLTAQQIADLLAVEQALLASNEAAALAAAAQATTVAAAVEAAALQSVANNAAANVQAAQVHVEAETAAVMANNQAVVDTQAALGAAQESLQNAEAAVLVADANVVSATQAHAAAEQAAVDALLDQINCEVDCEAVVAVFDVAVAETITSLAERQAAEAVASIAAQAVVQADQALTVAEENALAAIEAAIADSGMVADAQAALVDANSALDLANAAAAIGQSAEAAVQGLADDAAAAATLAAADLLAAQQAAAGSFNALNGAEANADAAAAAVRSTAADLELAELALDQAQIAWAAAQAALPDGLNDRILVPTMLDVQEAVFAGAINPGELSISRVISDDDADDLDTDTARFSGNFLDYIIEGDPGDDGIFGNGDDPFDALEPGAFIGDFGSRNAVDGTLNVALDGFIEIIDTRPLPTNLLPDRLGNDGRDLVRNVERLVFADQTIVLPAGAAGAGAPNNSVTMGQATIVSSTPTASAPFETLAASMDGVTDADNISDSNPLGEVTSLVDYYWQVEAEPGSGHFSTIVRLTGNAGNGDAFEVHGETLETSVDEIGLQVRIEAIFQDDALVFEIAHSEPVTVAVPPGFVAPPGLVGILPATFLGTPSDIVDAIAAQDPLINPLVENASKTGLPRIDLTISNVPGDLFANTGFGAEIMAADEVLVEGFLLVFTDSMGNVTGEFAPEIVAITDLVTSVVSQDAFDVLFSIRGADVTALVVPPFSIATLTVDGTPVANATFLGDSSVLDATGVSITLVNGSPLLNVATADFIGGPVAMVEPFTFANLSQIGAALFEFTVPQAEVSAFANTGFGVAITANESVEVGSGINLRFSQMIPVPPQTDRLDTGISRPRLVARVDELGIVSQAEVDVVFTIAGLAVESLVRGLTFVTLEVNGIPGTEVQTEILFGDSSVDEGIDVILLNTSAQLEAAFELANASGFSDAAAIAAATDALIAANVTALAMGQNAVDAAAAALALDPNANFLGNVADLNRTLNFENASNPLLPRLDFSLLDVDINLFANTGFGDAILAPDEILVDRIALVFTNPLAAVVGVFLPEAVAIQDPATLLVDQTALDLLWSIRGPDVAALVVGLTQATVTLDEVPVVSILLNGDSRINDAANVAQVVGAAPLQAANLLASSLILADPAATAVAQTSLVLAMESAIDSDGDGLSDSTDPCPFDPTNDVDVDGVCGGADNCPFDANVAQADTDFDGSGDACDNCPFVPNGPVIPDPGGNSQRDTDADGFGNLCDPDLTNDGIVNFGDFARFQQGWLGTDPDLDLNGDGVTNFGDLVIFTMYMFGVPGQPPTP